MILIAMMILMMMMMMIAIMILMMMMMMMNMVMIMLLNNDHDDIVVYTGKSSRGRTSPLWARVSIPSIYRHFMAWKPVTVPLLLLFLRARYNRFWARNGPVKKTGPSIFTCVVWQGCCWLLGLRLWLPLSFLPDRYIYSCWGILLFRKIYSTARNTSI